MALDFILDSFLKKAERVEIFYLDFGAKFICAARADADVGVAAERTFFHVAVANSGVEHDLAKRREISVGLFGSTHVRLGNNFAKGRAAAVVVDVGLSGGFREAFMQIFCSVFFEMETRYPDSFLCALMIDFDPAIGGEGQFVLRDLIALR